MSSKDWQDNFSDPVHLLRPADTTVSKEIFLNVLDQLHTLADKDTPEAQKLFLDLVELCREPRYRPLYPGKIATLLSMISGQSQISWRGKIEVEDDIRNSVLALTTDGKNGEVLLLAVQEAAKMSKKE